MKEFLKKIPLPMAGLILALASIGNLLSGFSIYLRWACFIISLILFLMVTMKLFIHREQSKIELANPVILSVFPTISMSIIIFSTYIKSFSLESAKIIWILGVFLHIILMLVYTFKVLFSLDLKKIFPSIFIVYVGIVTASVAAPAVGYLFYGKVIFWFGLLSYILLLPLVIYKLVMVNNISEKTLPLLVIMAAPSNLCLAGYMSSFKSKNWTMVLALLCISMAMNLYAYISLYKCRKLSFAPSFSAFTFPLVIGAIATKKVASAYGYDYILNFSTLQIILSVVVVGFVLIKYLCFLYEKLTTSGVSTETPS